eukprot:3620498-Pleurochrysis_carterae.AAC.1
MHGRHLSNKGTLDHTGARHIQRHCSAQDRENRQSRNIRNGAAYLVQEKMSAVQKLKAVSVVGFVGVFSLDTNETDLEISHTIRWKACVIASNVPTVSDCSYAPT